MSVSMAIVDFIPVILFLIAAVLIQRGLYEQMSKGAFALLSAGTIMVFCAGFMKALWKLLCAMNLCDFERLNQTFFPMQALGFLLAGISIVALLFFPQQKEPLLAAGTPAVFGGTMIFVSMMVLGCFCFSGGLGVYALRQKKKKAAVLFWAAFLFMMAMGYLSSRDFNGLSFLPRFHESVHELDRRMRESGRTAAFAFRFYRGIQSFKRGIQEMKKTVLYELKKRFWVKERDLGANRVLKKNGMTFTLSAYEIGNLGAMSVIEMSAMFGLMQMESFILTASEKDLPLYSGDFIKAAGKCTLLEEFYDTMLTPLDEESVDRYREVKARYASLPPYKTEPRWYDDIRYDFTLGATDRSLKKRKEEITADYLAAYLANADSAPACDPAVTRRSRKRRRRPMWTDCSRTEVRR